MQDASRHPDQDIARRHLQTLSKALLGLHKTLLDSEKIGYEQSFGAIPTPGVFLNLVMGDPWFAWLRSLSEFIVAIDETLDMKNRPITADDTRLFLSRARALLTPSETGTGFGLHYHNAMQRDPDVILAHARFMALLASLDEATKQGK